MSFSGKMTAKTPPKDRMSISRGKEENVEAIVEDIFEAREKKQRIEDRRKRILKKKHEDKSQDIASKPEAHKKQDEIMFTVFRNAQQQMQASKERLEKLRAEGEELISNIFIAGSAKECNRKAIHMKATHAMEASLQDANAEARKKFEEIMKKWESPESMKFARDLYKLITQQKEACDLLLQEKDDIIAQLKDSVRMKETEFESALEKNNKDLILLCFRVDQLVLDLAQACKEECRKIEGTFHRDRQNTLASNQEFLDKIVAEQKKALKGYVEAMIHLFDENEHNLHRCRLETLDEYNVVKNCLEEDIQTLTQTLRHLKSRFLLNQEQMDYNYQVLRRQMAENKVIMSQQMRLVLRLNDESTQLQARLRRANEQGDALNTSLTRNYRRLTHQINDISDKVTYYKNLYKDQFQGIWLLNETEAQKVARELLKLDEVIHQQILGASWPQPPPMEFLNNQGPIAPAAPAEEVPAKTAMDLVRSVLLQEELSDDLLQEEEEFSEESSARHPLTSEDLDLIRSPYIQHILHAICHEMDFMIEEKSLRLLGKLEKNAKILMSLDAIFRVIELDTEEDVVQLASHLAKYARVVDGRRWLSSSRLLHGLTDFIQDFKVCREKTPDFLGECVYDHRNNSGDQAYWDQYRGVLSTSRLALWKALQAAIYKYHFVLKKRHSFLERRHNLLKANCLLKKLVSRHLSTSKG